MLLLWLTCYLLPKLLVVLVLIKRNHSYTQFLIEGKKRKNATKKEDTNTGESQENSTSFTWSEEELELLLNVIQHYIVVSDFVKKEPQFVTKLSRSVL